MTNMLILPNPSVRFDQLATFVRTTNVSNLPQEVTRATLLKVALPKHRVARFLSPPRMK